jgi:hypothetical protein
MALEVNESDQNSHHLNVQAKLKLPHPYFTTYYAILWVDSGEGARHQFLQIVPAQEESDKAASLALHHETLRFSTPILPDETSVPQLSDNTSWARAQRAPISIFKWDVNGSTPSPGQIWLLVYAILSMSPEFEVFRAKLNCHGSDELWRTSRRHCSPTITQFN